MRHDLPTGTVTFCFTDVEGSTRLLHELGAEAYAEALAEHRALIREACISEGGVEVDTQGDAFFFAFAGARAALAAASSFTDALAATPIRVRCGLHTGTPLLAEEGYVGHDVHLAARVASAGHGGQVLVSSSTAELLSASGSEPQALLASGGARASAGAADRGSEPQALPLVLLGWHRLKDVSEPIRLYQLGEGSFPPLRTIANSNLPTPASSFLGRERELYEADQLLRSTRLLTISGPGGQGKTRFALELARRAREERFSDYPDGVFSCFLASLRDPSLVLATIAQALSVKEEPGRSALETLSAHLADKRMLLLVDNLEHLLAAAPELSELLQACPSLTLLATSRERLRLQGELPYELPPLAEEEGFSLFCERARVEPSPTIRELCTRLEGLPLAIELAAARLTLLSPEQLLERLSGRLDLLKGTRDADPRQQTLRATIEWSYDLLSEDEQRLFRSLSVFRGGCTLEAAEEVCGAELDTLESLLDKSLLRRMDTEAGPRFWMLETIRELAGERLAEAGEDGAARERHADFFLALAEELEPTFLNALDETTLKRLQAELDNLRATIEHLSTLHEPSAELRLVGSLFRFWEASGLILEGRRACEHALSRSTDAVDPSLRLKALYAASICAQCEGDWDASAHLEEERLAISRRIGDHDAEATALLDLGNAAEGAGDFELAAARFDDVRSLGHRLGETLLVAVAASNLANLAVNRRDYEAAQSLATEAIALASDLDDSWHVVPAGILGWSYLGLGEIDRAAATWEAVLEETHRAIGPVFSTMTLEGLVAVAAARQSFARAARLAGASHEAHQRLGFVTLTYELEFTERAERAGREALGNAAWEAEFAAGAAMSLEEAVAYALEAAVDV
jgi:predicted ATPase/class 3 adenylate cyclase